MTIQFMNKAKEFKMGAFTNKNYHLRLGDNAQRVSIKIDFADGKGQLEIFFDERDIDYLTARQDEVGRTDYKKKEAEAMKKYGLKSNPFAPDKAQPLHK